MSCFESFNLVVLILTLSRTNGLGSSYDLYARQNYMNLCRVPKKDKVWFDKLISFSKKNSTHSTKLLVNLIKIDNCHNNNCNIQRKLFNVYINNLIVLIVLTYFDNLRFCHKNSFWCWHWTSKCQLEKSGIICWYYWKISGNKIISNTVKLYHGVLYFFTKFGCFNQNNLSQWTKSSWSSVTQFCWRYRRW